MRKFGIAAALTVGLVVAVAAPSGATAATIDGPCATQQALFEKYGIGLGMHQPQVEYLYGQVCQITG